MTKCLECTALGGCTLDRSTDADHYEAHITVEQAEVEDFISACREIGVKPIVLDLQKRQGGVMKDMMTSSTIRGTYEFARAYADDIAHALSARGLRVVRKKLETTPWNRRTPSVVNGVLNVPQGTYFESHVPIQIRENERPALQALAHDLGFHLSRNAFKLRDDGTSIVMMTARSYDQLYEAFLYTVEKAKIRIVKAGFAVEKTLIEYAIWDTKITHDAEWTSV